VVVAGTGNAVGLYSVMNQPARGDETLLLSLLPNTQDTERLILKMIPTGDHRDKKQKAAKTLEPTRLVALCNSPERCFSLGRLLS
jgi:hypothetical protein